MIIQILSDIFALTLTSDFCCDTTEKRKGKFGDYYVIEAYSKCNASLLTYQ